MAETAEATRSDDRRKETKPSAHDHFSWTVLHAGIERWESYVSRYEKLKDKLDGEIKLAGLEILVLEELGKHLILNSNRFRTFEDARLEIVTYVEAKFGLRIRKSSEAGFCEHSDPMDVDAVNSSGKGRWSLSPRDGCFKCGGAHFSTRPHCTLEHRRAIAWQVQAVQVMVEERGQRKE